MIAAILAQAIDPATKAATKMATLTSLAVGAFLLVGVAMLIKKFWHSQGKFTVILGTGLAIAIGMYLIRNTGAFDGLINYVNVFS